jgi:RNA polymerase sigma-70 factor (ECF subfamily)
MIDRGMTSMGGSDPRFPSTLWSQVVAAGDAGHPGRRPALEELVRRYWKPVYAHIRFQWAKDNDKAKDLTQAFFAELLERGLIEGADRDKGSFRSYLKGSLKHYLLNVRRDEGRQKRGGGTVALPLDEVVDVPWAGADPARSAEEAFDFAWRSEVLNRGTEAVRQEYENAGKAAQWQAFAQLVLPREEARPTYEEVARELGLTVAEVGHALHNLRGRLREELRGILLEGLPDPRDLDTEWAVVFARRQP